MESEHPMIGEVSENQLTKFTFNLSTGEHKMEHKIDDKNLSFEFPIVNQNLVGYKTRYTYLAKYLQILPESKAGLDSAFFEGVFKYDLQEEKIVKLIKFGENAASGEVFFQPRDSNNIEDQEEDDGYLMTFVFDWVTQKSEFVMWDAKTMDDEPVLRA